MDIKEIALKVGAQGLPIEGTAHKFCVLDFCSKEVLIKFAEALVTEIAKQNEPCAFLHEWIEYHPFGDTFAGEPCAAITSDEKPFDSSDTVSPLFTFPPTAEQIAKGNEALYFPEATINLAPGEHYAGLVIGKDGKPSYHLVLLPGQADDITWDKAMEWAAK